MFLAFVGAITLFLCAVSVFAYVFGYIEGHLDHKRAQSKKDV